MDREQQFIADLVSLQHKQQPEERAFATRETNEARLTGRTAVRMWSAGEKDLSDQAFSFLVDIGDLAIVPILEGPLRDDPGTVSRAMFMLVNQELELRKRLVAQIETWLNDKRPVPQMPRIVPAEVRDSPRRVCDEAYAAMRRLVYFGEDEISQMVDEDRFYDLSEPMRDDAIKRARGTKSWRLVIDPDSVQD